MTSDEEERIKQRLQAVVERPENQFCCDCHDKKPTWASIIVPPEGVKPDQASAIGAFCCFHCSGAHRRLGVHICFVRSITLDSWKEKEVMAMEAGGNQRVNEAFEAKIGKHAKPEPTSDLETRNDFIRAKYSERQFWDPTKYIAQPPTNDLGYEDAAPDENRDSFDSKRRKSLPSSAEFDSAVFQGISEMDLFANTRDSWFDLPSSPEKRPARRNSLPTIADADSPTALTGMSREDLFSRSKDEIVELFISPKKPRARQRSDKKKAKQGTIGGMSRIDTLDCRAPFGDLVDCVEPLGGGYGGHLEEEPLGCRYGAHLVDDVEYDLEERFVSLKSSPEPKKTPTRATGRTRSNRASKSPTPAPGRHRSLEDRRANGEGNVSRPRKSKSPTRPTRRTTPTLATSNSTPERRASRPRKMERQLSNRRVGRRSRQSKSPDDSDKSSPGPSRREKRSSNSRSPRRDPLDGRPVENDKGQQASEQGEPSSARRGKRPSSSKSAAGDQGDGGDDCSSPKPSSGRISTEKNSEEKSGRRPTPREKRSSDSKLPSGDGDPARTSGRSNLRRSGHEPRAPDLEQPRKTSSSAQHEASASLSEGSTYTNKDGKKTPLREKRMLSKSPDRDDALGSTNPESLGGRKENMIRPRRQRSSRRLNSDSLDSRSEHARRRPRERKLGRQHSFAGLSDSLDSKSEHLRRRPRERRLDRQHSFADTRSRVRTRSPGRQASEPTATLTGMASSEYTSSVARTARRGEDRSAQPDGDKPIARPGRTARTKSAGATDDQDGNRGPNIPQPARNMVRVRSVGTQGVRNSNLHRLFAQDNLTPEKSTEGKEEYETEETTSSEVSLEEQRQRRLQQQQAQQLLIK